MITLETGINDSQTTIVLNRFFTAAEFPEAGTILIESEEIHYSHTDGNKLLNCTRGFNGTSAVAHLRDVLVAFVSEDVSLTPVVNLAEAVRDRIITPTKGMLIYNTDSDKLNVYTGSTWEEVASA